MPIGLAHHLRPDGSCATPIELGMHGSIRQRSAGSYELRVFIGTDPTRVVVATEPTTVRGNRAEAERELADMVASVRAARAVGVRSPVERAARGVVRDRRRPGGRRPRSVRPARCSTATSIRTSVHLAVGEVTPATSTPSTPTLRRRGGSRAATVVAGHARSGPRRAALGVRPGDALGMDLGQPSRARPPHRRRPAPSSTRRRRTNCAPCSTTSRNGPDVARLRAARRDHRCPPRPAPRPALAQRHLDTSRVSFCAGWVEGPDGPVLTATKTKRRHVVDLDPASFAVLADHAERVGDEARDGFVFSDDGGITAWKPNRVTKAFLRHRRAAGLRSFRLHDLRHFMATEMLHAGVPIVVVSRRLDHRRVSTTLDNYAHAVPGGDAQASATLRQILTVRPS